MTANLYSFLDLPTWVPESTADNILFFDLLKVMCQNITDDLFEAFPQSVIVEQTTEPLQVQWETAWTTAGYTLPIPSNAILIWRNTSNSTIGGMYGTTPLSSTVVRREPQYPRTGTCFRQIYQSSSAVSSSVSIGVNNSNHPSASVTIPVLSDVYLLYSLQTVLSSGSGQWGADFLWDGLKVGTQYNALPSNQGIINISATGLLAVRAKIPNVQPGIHTVQAIFGVTGSPASPPTIAYGGIGSGAGNYGLRQLEVRAVTK